MHQFSGKVWQVGTSKVDKNLGGDVYKSPDDEYGSIVFGELLMKNFEKMMLWLLFASHLCAIALAAPQNYYQPQYQQDRFAGTNKNVVPIVSETNEQNSDGSFSYSYSTGDGQQVQAQGYLKNAGNKETEAEVIQGSYSYTAPDGTPITVTYIADELGFRAQGAHLPTPPPIPEAIQRSLELIAQAQKTQPQGQASLQSQNYKPNPYKRVYPRHNSY